MARHLSLKHSSKPQHSMLDEQCTPLAMQHDGSVGAPACWLRAQTRFPFLWPQHCLLRVHSSPIPRQLAAVSSPPGAAKSAARGAPAVVLASAERIPRRVEVADRE